MKTPALIPAEVAALRAAIFKAKTEKRAAIRRAPIEEKLRMLEEMRDFTAATKLLREENKASVKSAWKRT